MASKVSSRTVLLGNFVVLGLGAIVLAVPASMHALSPDIPRLESDAQRGSIKQQIELGAAYFAGRGVAQDEKRAAYWYEKAANAGDPGAQMEIGYFYQVGIGVTRDPVQAVRWFQRSAAGGMISAKVNLGAAYLLGDGVRQDPALAEQLFREAYAQKSGLAACNLGDMYDHGVGVQRDEVLAEKWYEAGVKLHNQQAEFRLATLLWQRHRDADEVKRAVKLYRESATGGMVAAKHQLAIVLLKRPQLAASQQEAPALLKESAEAGEWRSSVALGLLSRDGLAGTAADPKTAYYHYRLAALQGGDEARRVVGNDLEAISRKLGPEQTAAVDADANAWFQNHHVALQFINKDGVRSREYPTYAVANPDSGMHAGRLVPGDLLTDTMGPAIRKPVSQ